MLWQLLFVLFSTSWLWAPYLNPAASPHNTMVSTYEATAQPYSWLFRICDIIGAALLFSMAQYILRHRNKTVGILLIITSFGMVIDAIFATTCTIDGSNCIEKTSLFYYIHAIESGLTGLTIFLLAVYDILRRKRWSSIGFAAIQLLYVLLFITGWAKEAGLATLSQFIYLTTLSVWIAWLCRELLKIESFQTVKSSSIKNAIAVWAFFNGILAIIVSLAHIHLFGRIKGLYFAGDSAWLAQHGVIIGITMLYISRHLARGEARARQIFLFISGVEVIKYALITPHPTLLILYLLTFLVLFVWKDDFDRGTVPLTWRGRITDLYFMLGGLLATLSTAFIVLDRDSRISTITQRTFEHFFTYASNQEPFHSGHLRSILLAHTMSVFLIMVIGALAWIMFRPYKTAGNTIPISKIKQLLEQYSHSSEDYFKFWPQDKSYFVSQDGQSFVAYKTVGSVIFALADPIGLDPQQALNEFNSWCKQRRLTVCFLPVYEERLDVYKSAGLQTMQIGSSAIITIDTFLETTVTSKWWRWQRNRSTKQGYEYRKSTPPHSTEFMKQLQTISDEWLTKDGRQERGFSLGYFDTGYMQQSVIHYLIDSEGQAIAFTNELPQYNQTNIASIDLLRYSEQAPHAMPFLLSKTIEELKASDSQLTYFDLGFVPFAKVQGSLLQIAKTLSAGRFSAKGLEQFKNKFEPDWQPNYIAYDGDVVDLANIALGIERVMEPTAD